MERPLQDGGFVTYGLTADRRYSTFFKISNVAGTWNVSEYNFSEIYTDTVLYLMLEWVYVCATFTCIL